ncbi:MAG: hypothetical protein JWP89_6810 [Schlesneria sp.]|nr:hypothetical protein [Schlesneria sp.]
MHEFLNDTAPGVFRKSTLLNLKWHCYCHNARLASHEGRQDGDASLACIVRCRSPGLVNGLHIGGDAIWAGVVDFGDDNGGVCNSALPINARTTDINTQTLDFGSMHTGGCHFLMGDGSVRFISENVDRTTYTRLASISDGQVIGEY